MKVSYVLSGSARRFESWARSRRVPTDEGLHLIVDRPGLSMVGDGEWAAAKHGGRGKRG